MNSHLCSWHVIERVTRLQVCFDTMHMPSGENVTASCRLTLLMHTNRYSIQRLKPWRLLRSHMGAPTSS
jgi:hypothetical protein